MTIFNYDIGIIGGGAAGLTITAGAAQLGARAILMEKEKVLGGDCLHFGCIPSKTLITSAKIYHQFKNPEPFGLPKLAIPPVDFHAISNRIRLVISTIQKHDSLERFCTLGAQVELGHPIFKDEHTVSMNGTDYTAKNWVIATGSSPSIPPIKGLDGTSFLTNRNLFSLSELPESMTIFGAGPIGIEMAQAFNRLGTRITVIDRADQILIREDIDLARELQSILEAEGITFHLNTKIQSVRDDGLQKEIFIENEKGETITLHSKEILVATGRKPNIEGIGLEKLNIAVNDKGIIVDNRLRTHHKNIYAAGDVTGSFQFTHAAGYEGSIVISNTIFHLPRKVNYRYLPWCTYSDPEFASIGINEKNAAEQGIQYKVWSEEFKNNDRSIVENKSPGKIKMILDEKDSPIGIQILGPHAGDLISEWIAVFNGRLKLSSIASAIHPYPTIGEINKRVAGNFFSPKIFSNKVKKGLKFFFNLKGRACTEESPHCNQCTL